MKRNRNFLAHRAIDRTDSVQAGALYGDCPYGRWLQNIDMYYAVEREIPVCNVPDYGTEEVVGHISALILCSVAG